MLNPAVSKEKRTVGVLPASPLFDAPGAGDGADGLERAEGGIGAGGCVPEDEDSSDGGSFGGDDDYELNDAWEGGGEEEEHTVVLGEREGNNVALDEEIKPEEAAIT
jgi:hypothetical protein